MTTHRSALLLLALIPVFWLSQAQADAAADVTVTAPTVRAIPPVAPNSAGFMRIRNNGDQPRTLVAVSGAVAKAIELHTHLHDGGVMRMRRIAHIHLPPKKTVVLKPGGMHVMLFGIAQPLKTGESVQLTLEFADGSKLPVSFRVVDIRR